MKKWGLSSFGQFGFLDARVAVEVMLSLKRSQLTAKGINAAFLRIKNWKSDLLCKPFYGGNLPGHVPNNWDITTTGKNGKDGPARGLLPDRTGDARDQGGTCGGKEVQAEQRHVVPEARVAAIGREVDG